MLAARLVEVLVLVTGVAWRAGMQRSDPDVYRRVR